MSVVTSFRFLHAADIHLDSPLKGLAGQEESIAERIRTATREALDQLVGIAIEEQVAFLIIAGDLYDGDWRDYNTGLYFIRQMGRLNQAGIPVYLLHGNHDAESQITRRLALPDNVQVFGSRRPESSRIDDLGVVLHGQSFGQRAVIDNLALTYPEPVARAFNIGVLHTGLGGMGGHDDYAPCSLADLVNKGYDYWALGHVHQAAVLHERPHIVFPGNLQGRHVRETGAKGATLVAVESGEVVELATVSCRCAGGPGGGFRACIAQRRRAGGSTIRQRGSGGETGGAVTDHRRKGTRRGPTACAPGRARPRARGVGCWLGSALGRDTARGPRTRRDAGMAGYTR